MKEHRFPRILALAAVAALTLSPAVFAQPPGGPGNGNPPEQAGPPQEVVDMLLERGFHQVEPNVFQRPNEDASVDTVAYDADGHEYLVRILEARVQSLEDQQAINYLTERAEAIASYQAWIDDFQAYIDEVRAASGPGPSPLKANPLTLSSLSDAATACDSTLHRLADTKALTDGPNAHGEASFTDSCSAYGEVSVNTTVSGWESSNELGMFDNCFQPGNGSATCSATSHVIASTNCSATADAVAKITADDGGFGFPSLVSWLVSESNTTTCRILGATLTGTSSLSVPCGACRTGSWSVSATGGSGSYSYAWTYDGVAVGGNSTSYARSYCNNLCNGAGFIDTVAVKVTDSAGAQVTRSKGVSISYGGTIDPCFLASQTPGSLSGAQVICP